jgi:hypothetical protein
VVSPEQTGWAVGTYFAVAVLLGCCYYADCDNDEEYCVVRGLLWPLVLAVAVLRQSWGILRGR